MLRLGRILGGLSACIFGGLETSLRLLDLATGAFLGFPARVVLGLAPRFLSGGKDGDFFLFAALRVAAG